ncbi:MAG: GNAT family N-acetyltransferase [Actinomycetota bacterium]
MPPGYVIRPVDTTADLATAVEILRTCDLHDVGFDDVSAAWIKEDWTSSAHRGAWIVEVAGGRPCAFANLGASDPASTIDSFAPVLPAQRESVRPALLELVEREARSFAVGTPTLLASFSHEEGAGPAVEAAGFSFARVFWHMERAIDPSFVPIAAYAGVAIRPYAAGDDDELGWRLLDQAFAGHFGMDPMSYQDYLHDVIAADSWDPSLAAIGELDGTPVGIVTGYLMERVGWIVDLGVIERGRDRGVGRALLERGFALLATRGASRVQLNVDSENATGATHLYEAAGMTVRRSFDCYEKRLVPR